MTSRAFRQGNEAATPGPDDASAQAEHRFSENYRQRRQALIAEYGGAQEGCRAPGASPSRLKWRTMAIATAAALVVVPVSAWAVASNVDFFAGAFGGSARESVQAHDEVQEYKDGKPVTVTYPTREYVETDAETAEELLGQYVSSEETAVTIGDHVLTIQSAVRDENTMVVGYTLERQGGVTALQWNELTNQGKGAYQSNDGPYTWDFVAGTAEERKAAAPSENPDAATPDGESGEQSATGDDEPFANWASDCTLVDPQRSTADKLYCYDYLIFDEAPAGDASVTLRVSKRHEDGAGNGTTAVEQEVDIPLKDAVPGRTLGAEGVGAVTVSPLSLSFAHTGDGDIVDERIARADYEKYFGERFGSFEDFLEGCYSETDVDACSKIVVKYRDGSEYTMFDDIADLDNTANAFGRDGGAIWMFNRLVNPQEVESITVNDVVFS